MATHCPFSRSELESQYKQAYTDWVQGRSTISVNAGGSGRTLKEHESPKARVARLYRLLNEQWPAEYPAGSNPTLTEQTRSLPKFT